MPGESGDCTSFSFVVYGFGTTILPKITIIRGTGVLSFSRDRRVVTCTERGIGDGQAVLQ